MKIARKLFVGSFAAVSGFASAQVPDLLSSFDAGGRAFGAGGAFYVTSSETLSATNNPAGLGYVNQATAGAAARSFSKTTTTVTGPLNNLRLDTDEDTGDIRMSHLGYARPMSGGRGAWGIAWTVGGYMNDDRIGQNLPGGIQNYFDNVRIQTDFLNLSWGRANSDQTMSFGVGLVVAMNSILSRQFIQFSDPQTDPINARSDKKSYGFGAQVGVMLIPKNRPNMTIGASLRSPIEITSSDESLALYDRIPGRAALGIALRQEGYRGGRDYVIYGAEAEYFFGASGSDRVQRDDHFAGHIGFEYNYVQESFTIPIRFGFAGTEAGGDGFDDRTSMTFGIGYRQLGKPWSIDIAFGNSNRGARDTAITFSYKL